MKISIVIPTWNEETWLPRLLESLKPIASVDEIIIADNNSIDHTVALAKRYDCKIVQGGKPAQGRNAGGRAAKNDLIIFIDADAIVTPPVIEALEKIFSDPKVIGAHFSIQPITSDKFIIVCYWLMNLYFYTLLKLGVAQGIGGFIAVRKSAFEKVGGFDETLEAAEDTDFHRRLGKVGKVIFEPKHKVLVSARRYSIEKPMTFILKCLVWAPLRLFGIQASLINYRWSIYSDSLLEQEAMLLQGMGK